MATFAHRLPAWTGPDGFPLSWRHYVYGSAYIGRADAREDVRAASAHRVSQADQKGYRAWLREMGA